MPKRHELTDEQWNRLEPLLPSQKPEIGRPRESHRRMINGILWILKTGAPWRDLPDRYGPWQTVYGRFNQWRKDGLWQRLFQRLQSKAQAEDEIDWEVHFVDGSIVQAHQHAAGAAKKGTHKR